MGCNERGMALVSVIVLLSVLLSMAHILSDKVWKSMRQSAAADRREKLFWAAQAGIEAAREQLAATYASSANWQNYLSSGSAGNYPAEPIWSIAANDIPVDIYLRDNPDGDSNVQVDNDLKIFVLACARGRHGAQAVVESLCGFDPLTAQRFLSGGQARYQHNDLPERPVNIYDIAE